MNTQQRLFDAIWADSVPKLTDNDFNNKGISIYRRNLLANAQRALSISFPTIFALLDSDISDELVKQFLMHSLPDQGDWAQWGEAFSHFLANTEIGHDYPYLSDCALLDWHVHCTLSGIDQTLDVLSLSILQNVEPEKIIIEFNQNVRLINTQYPIVDIFHAHHHNDQIQRDNAMNKAQIALSKEPEKHTVMIYRPEFQPKVESLSSAESQFMLCLQSKNTLAIALDTVSQNDSFSFENWLVSAIERNLIYNFKEN